MCCRCSKSYKNTKLKHKIILIKLEKENKKFWIFFFKNFHFFLQFFKKCGFFQNFRFSNKYLIINFWDMTLVYGAKCISWFWRFHFWKLLWCARTSARCVPLKMRKMLIFAYILSALVEYSSAQRARKCARAQNVFFIVRARHFRCVLHLERKNFIKNSNL